MYKHLRVWTVLLLVGLLVRPGVAHAGGWPRPVDGAVVLGYGASWFNGAGAPCTHGGVDLAAASGDPVRCCVAGTVTFAGLVPAAGGGSVTAVTVQDSDGLRVTCMPLASSSARRGDVVAPGQVLGTLEATGDGSSAGAHLHLSVRRGEASLDPMAFLCAQAGPAAAPSGVSGPTDSAVRLGTEAAQPAPALSPAASAAAPGARSAAVRSATPETAKSPTSSRSLAAVQAATASIPAPVAAKVVVDRALARAKEAASGSAVAMSRLPEQPHVHLGSLVESARRWCEAGRSAGARLLLAAVAAAALAPMLKTRSRTDVLVPAQAPARGTRA